MGELIKLLKDNSAIIEEQKMLFLLWTLISVSLGFGLARVSFGERVLFWKDRAERLPKPQQPTSGAAIDEAKAIMLERGLRRVTGEVTLLCDPSNPESIANAGLVRDAFANANWRVEQTFLDRKIALGESTIYLSKDGTLFEEQRDVITKAFETAGITIDRFDPCITGRGGLSLIVN